MLYLILYWEETNQANTKMQTEVHALEEAHTMHAGLELKRHTLDNSLHS